MDVSQAINCERNGMRSKQSEEALMRGLTRRSFLVGTAGLLLACRGQQSGGATPTVALGEPTPSQEEPRRGGILHFNLPGDPANFDLHQAGTGTDLWVLAPCFDMLVQYDPNDHTKIIPDLAERWEISGDRTEYIFYLKKNVRFHDGSPFTSRDVVVNLERILYPPQGMNSPRRVYFTKVERVEAVDEYTVKIKLSAPDESLLANLAMPWMGFYPAHLIEKGADLRGDPNNIIGTGPFRFKSYTPGVLVELARNDEYHVEGLPYLDGIAIHPFSDANAAVQALIAGQLHLHRLATTPPLALLEGYPEIAVEVLPSTSVTVIRLNARQFEPFKDARVRQAMNLALSRDDALQAINEGRGKIGGWMHPDGPWALAEDKVREVPGFAVDKAPERERAKALLAEAGYPDGFEVELIWTLDETVPSFVTDQLARINVRTRVQLLQFGEYSSRVNDRAYQMSIGRNAAWVDDPKSTFALWVTCDDQLNQTGLCDERLVELYQRTEAEANPETRKQLVNELDFATLDGEEFGMLYLVRTAIWYVFWRDKIGGFVPKPNYYLTEKHLTTWLRGA